MLQHGLLVLGVVVLGVLRDVPELARLADTFGDFFALDGGEKSDLVLELLESFRCEDDFFPRHWRYLPC